MKFNLILAYYAVINIIGAVINSADKYKAKKNKWRIKEKTLWLIGLFGGALGSFITMKLVHHKTKHMSFMIIMPILAVTQALFIIYLYLKISGRI